MKLSLLTFIALFSIPLIVLFSLVIFAWNVSKAIIAYLTF